MSGEITFTAKDGRQVVLREAVPEDAGGLLEAVRSAADERSYVMTEKRARSVEEEYEYIANLDRQKNLLLVAECDGKVVGGLAALQADGGRRSNTAHICNVGLHLVKECRNLGVGSRMLEYAINWSKGKGYLRIESNIFTVNKRSLGLFKKFGFMEGICEKQYRIGSGHIEEVCVAYLHSH
ncbi:MAG: GNAT family N-acetyltransferase [Bacillota bacterium]